MKITVLLIQMIIASICTASWVDDIKNSIEDASKIANDFLEEHADDIDQIQSHVEKAISDVQDVIPDIDSVIDDATKFIDDSFLMMDFLKNNFAPLEGLPVKNITCVKRHC